MRSIVYLIMAKFNECSDGTSCLFPISWPISLFSLDSHLVQSNSTVSAFHQPRRSSQCCHPETSPFVAHELCVLSIRIASAWMGISRLSIGYWRIRGLRWSLCTYRNPIESINWNDIYRIKINLECNKNKTTYVFDHSNEQTCDLESIESMSVPLLTFQNFIQRSAVPPPVAKTFGCHGHHARARTAAWCWLNMWSGSVTPFGVSTLALVPVIDGQIFTKLSFPPLAKYLKSFDHLRPHTSEEIYD